MQLLANIKDFTAQQIRVATPGPRKLNYFWLAFFLVLLCLPQSQTGLATSSLGLILQRRATARQPRPESYGAPRKLGEIQLAAINESSGLVASRRTPGLYWTHNDSGDGPFLYALDTHGKSRGVWRVAGAEARDWEDIAIGPGPVAGRPYLYVGDIGDNSEKRSGIVVYRVPEPPITASDARATKAAPRLTETTDAIRLRYPDGKHDAETLLVHPTTGNLYIVTKKLLWRAEIYEAKAPLRTSGTTTLTLLGDLNIPSILGGVVTGGDISPDGSRVAFCDYLRGYEIVLKGRSSSFDDIWKEPIRTIDLGSRKQGEGICYRLDGKALLTTSEGRHSPIMEVVRR
jgi:hypothetical protein